MAHDWHELPAWWWETNGAQGGGALNRCAAERGTARATLPCSHDMPLASSTRTVARASGGCAAALPRGCGSEAGLCCRLAPFGERAPRPLPTRGAGCGAASARKTGGGGEWPDPSCAELAQARNASSVSNCGTSSPGKSASQLRRAVSMSAAVGTQKDGSSVMGSIAVEMVVLPSGRPTRPTTNARTREKDFAARKGPGLARTGHRKECQPRPCVVAASRPPIPLLRPRFFSLAASLRVAHAESCSWPFAVTVCSVARTATSPASSPPLLPPCDTWTCETTGTSALVREYRRPRAGSRLAQSLTELA